MKRKNKFVPILLGLLLIVAIAVTGLSGGTLTTLAKLFSLSPLAPPPSPTAMMGVGASPLGTPVPPPQWTATPIPVVTAIPTISPPPGYPTDEPLPQVTPEQPGTTPVRPPSLAPLGFPPADQQALYYVADNAGFSELHVVGMDTQGGKQSEFRAVEDAALGGMNLVGLYPSPDGKYLALEFLGDGYGEVKIVERTSGRVWCPLEGLEGCWGAFEGWGSGAQILFRPGNVPPEGVVPMGVIVVDLETGHYTPLDLPVEPRWGYSLAQNVSPSPDGSRLAYSIVEVENGEEIVEIWTMRMDGGGKQCVYRAKGGIGYLSWSPNGKQLIYVYQSEPGEFFPGELRLLNADGNGDRLLATDLPEPGELRFYPAWSPDGRYVAFVQLDQPMTFDGTYIVLAWSNVYVVDTITGQITRLSSFERQEANFPTWSPDSRFVAFVSTARREGVVYEEDIYSEVWIASADGSQLYAISRMAKPWNALAWLPPVSATGAR